MASAKMKLPAMQILYLLGKFSIVMSRARQLTGQAHVLGWQGWEPFLQWAAFLVLTVNFVVQLKVFLSELDAVLLWRGMLKRISLSLNSVLLLPWQYLSIIISVKLGLYMKFNSVIWWHTCSFPISPKSSDLPVMSRELSSSISAIFFCSLW